MEKMSVAPTNTACVKGDNKNIFIIKLHVNGKGMLTTEICYQTITNSNPKREIFNQNITY
jgi:hypothetical protein